MSTIAVLGTLDTKGEEHAWLASLIQRRGHKTLLIDVGTGGDPVVQPDIDRFSVAATIGLDLEKLMVQRDRGECVVGMSKAAPALLKKLAEDRQIDGVVSLGGGGGTAIGSAAMRALPLGFPKVMVSTLASGNTAHYIGTSDITMIPAVVDVAGLNRISRLIFSRAAGAICGMVEMTPPIGDAKPLVVASMFGNTTECVTEAKRIIEEAGYEVLIFAATGAGGRAMEDLIASGLVGGVLDITTTEWADELVGATLSAGPERLDAAGRAGVPAVVVPGCLDMANFGERDSLPEKFEGRKLYIHNPQVTLMRTTPEECARLGEIIAEKTNRYTAPVTILLPLKGISVISSQGGSFHDPAADDALFTSIRQKSNQPIVEIDETINSPVFARACAYQLLEAMGISGGASISKG